MSFQTTSYFAKGAKCKPVASWGRSPWADAQRLQRLQRFQSNQQQSNFPTKEPTQEEVIAAVQSLYTDELKPFGRVLLKRLREHAAARVAEERGLPSESVDPDGMPKIDPRILRRICDACDSFTVEASGCEYSIKVRGLEGHFLDICSPNDPYPAAVWEAFDDFCSGFGEGEMQLPGGRYTCARKIFACQLPFLAGRSLAQLCHIVHLATTQKRILGYYQGFLVPYRHSEDYAKERRATARSPMMPVAGGQPVADWSQACEGLRQMVHENVATCDDFRFLSERGDERLLFKEGAPITISRVKRLFGIRFGLELCETALGYTTLLDLMRDTRLRQICTLRPQRNGQVRIVKASSRAMEGNQQPTQDTWSPHAPTPLGHQIPVPPPSPQGRWCTFVIYLCVREDALRFV